MKKKYVLIIIFSLDYKKVLLIHRKKPPYANCYNGVGGKIEPNESPEEAAYRECREETGISDITLDYLCSISYPKGSINNNMEMHVFTGVHREIQISSNSEGDYTWKDLSFASDYNNTLLAGYGNVAVFVKEALIKRDLNQTC